jgi:hypothetical protein
MERPTTVVPGWLNYTELADWLTARLGRPIRKGYLVQIVSESQPRPRGSRRVTPPRHLDNPFPLGQKSGGTRMWPASLLGEIERWFTDKHPGAGGGAGAHKPGCQCGRHPTKSRKRRAA